MADEHQTSPTREIVGHPRHTGRFWFDVALAGCAILISLVSLYVAVGGERTQRELLAANAWPFLEATLSVRSGGALEIEVRNEGVGPAKVFDFEIDYRGRPVHTPRELLERCCGVAFDASGVPKPNVLISNGDVAGSVIRPDAAQKVLTVGTPDGVPGPARSFAHILSDLGFRSCYCSILDACWMSDLRDLRPERVRSCRGDLTEWEVDEPR